MDPVVQYRWKFYNASTFSRWIDYGKTVPFTECDVEMRVKPDLSVGVTFETNSGTVLTIIDGPCTEVTYGKERDVYPVMMVASNGNTTYTFWDESTILRWKKEDF